MTFILWGTGAGNKVDFSASFNLVSDFHLTWDGSGDGDLGVHPGEFVFRGESFFFAKKRIERDQRVKFLEPDVFRIGTGGPELSEPVQAEFLEPTLFEVGAPDVWSGGIFNPRDPISDVVGSERDEVSEVFVP